MTTSRRDIITGAVFAAGALVLFAVASGYPTREGQPVAMGPGFYPRLLAALLGILALIQIITAVLKERQARREKTPEEALPPIWKDRSALVLFSVTLGMLVAYPFFMRLIGFAVTGFLFLGTLIYTLSSGFRDRKGLIIAGIITLGITLLTYFVFKVFLRIPFPDGLIRF